MKCFYHVEDDAVATCQRCGKGLCHDCAAKHTPCYCEECFEAVSIAAIEEQEEEEKEYRSQKKRSRAARNARKRDALIDTNAEMIKAIIIGLAAYAAGAIAFYLIGVEVGAGEAGNAYLKDAFQACFIFFFVPFGWSAISWLESKIMPNLFFPIGLMLMYFGIKLSLSLIIGIPMFLVQVIKWLIGLIRAAATK